MSYIIRKIYESSYIPKSIPSVCTTIFNLIAGLLFLSKIFDVIHQWICLDELYKLLESFFSNKFKLVFELLTEDQKLYIFRSSANNSAKSKGVNIDQSAMCYISMDLSQQALQTNGKRFSNFGIIFWINYNFFK